MKETESEKRKEQKMININNLDKDIAYDVLAAKYDRLVDRVLDSIGTQDGDNDYSSHWHIVNSEKDYPKEYGEYLTVTEVEDDRFTNYLVYENQGYKKGWHEWDGTEVGNRYKVLAWLDTDYPQQIKDILKEGENS